MKRLINQLYLIVSLLTLAVLLPQGVQAQGKDVSDYFYYYSEYSETGAPIKTESYSENFYGGNHSFPQLYNAQQLGNISYSSSDESVATVDANGGVSAVGVGSTTITASFPGGDGFEPCSASYTLELTDGRRDPGYLFGWDGETGTGVYGGTASTPILNFGQLGQSPTITFSSSNTTVATVDASGVTIVGVGSTVITAAFEGNDEYKPATSSFTLTISAATVTASGFTASNKTYDGTTDATLSGGTVTGLVGSDVVTVSATGAFADVNVGTGKTVTISGLTLGGADAGNYELDASNSQASTTADITAKTLTVTAEAKSKVYGETDPALTYTSAGLVGNDQLTGSLTREAGENVGSYSITQGTLSASSNYTLTFTGSSMTIGQKEAALSWSDLSFTYDGSEHVPTATVSNLVSGDACTVTVSGAASVVGTYTATATALSNSNYTLPATATQSFTISAATMSGVSASGFSGTYDGAAHGISVTTPSGATVSYGTSAGSYGETASPTYTNVGSNTVYYQVTMIGYEPVSGSANVSITAREAALSWSDLSFTYDGQEHVPTATVSNLVSGDACIVTVNGAASAVGTYTATATSLSNSNYTLPASTTQSFTISAATMSGVSASGFSGTYDGAAHGISVTAPSGATVSYGTSVGSYDETASPTYTNVGSNTVYYQVTMTGYEPVSGSADVSITAREAALSWSNLSFTYDGQEHVPTATVSNLVSGDACTVTVSGAASAVGTYTATATALSNSNYTLPASATQSFTISTNSMSGVSASGFSGTYDGAAHGISVTAPSGATVSYGTSADNYGETSSPTYTDAGTYTVYYQVTMTGYDTITGSATVSIAQANGFVMFSSTEAKGTVGESFTAPTVIVTPEDASLTYESSDPTVATVDDSGEVILLKAGSTRITATFDGNANYIGDSHYYDLTVIEPDLVLEPIVKEEDYELSGEDFLNPDGTDKDLSNTVIKSILFTLKNNTSADGDGYDSEESCIVINTVTSLSALQSLLSQGVAPGKQEYARQFTGLTFLVPAGEGYVIIDSQESNGYHLMVQVGSQTPISIYQLERDEFSIPYASTEDTYVYVWNDGTDVEAAARLRTIMKGKKTVANVRIYNVSYRANRPNGIQTVCLDADAADTGWYDLRGQRITQPQKKGLYINNGRKIVIK